MSIPINLSTRISQSPAVAACQLGDEAALLHLVTGTYYGLDPTGTRIWELAQEPTAVSELLAALLAEFDVDPEECERDLLYLLENLAGETLIEIHHE